MHIINDFNTLFHRCVNKRYPNKKRTLSENSKLPTPYASATLGSLENPFINMANPEDPYEGLSLEYHSMGQVLIYESEDSFTPEPYYVIDQKDTSVLVLRGMCLEETHQFNDSRNVDWDSCKLKYYLNNTFLEGLSPNLRKNIIPTYKGSIILLNEKQATSLINFKYAYTRIAVEGNPKALPDTTFPWWLEDRTVVDSSDKVKMIDGLGNIATADATESRYVRPAFWISKEYWFDNYINSLYNQSIEFDHNHRLCVREPFSNHNERIYGDLYKSWVGVKKDIAIVSIGTEQGLGFYYIYPFRDDKFHIMEDAENSIKDGIYFNNNMIIKVKDGKYSFPVGHMGYNGVKRFTDESVNSNLSATPSEGNPGILTLNSVSLYLGCWADDESNLWKLLPTIRTDHKGDGDHISWLGNVYKEGHPLYIRLKTLCSTFEQFL